MHMYRNFMSETTLFICSFTVMKSDVGVLNSPGWSMRLPLAVGLFL